MFQKKMMSILLYDIHHFTGLSDNDLCFLFDSILPEIGKILKKGSMINTWGDSGIAFFEDTEKAAVSALEILNLLNLPYNSQIKIRIALTRGEIKEGLDPITDRKSGYGPCVNELSRIEPIVCSNQVYATKSFHEDLKVRKSVCSSIRLGEPKLVKGWKPITLYLIYFNNESPQKHMPILTRPVDYDESMDEIKVLCDWIIKSGYCQKITLYVRDELTMDEYNIEVCKGLTDPSPMYGHLVWNDFRIEIDKKAKITFPGKPHYRYIFENPITVSTAFSDREGITSRACFVIGDEGDKKEPRNKAQLFFNWTNNDDGIQSNGEDKFIKFAESIFENIEITIKEKSMSRRRHIFTGRELYARRILENNRYLDHKTIEAKSTHFMSVLHRFFKDEKDHLDIKIKPSDSPKTWAELVPNPRFLDCNVCPGHCAKVSKDTRPLFIQNFKINVGDKGETKVDFIIVPIREHGSTLSENRCYGFVCIASPHGGVLKNEMVRPLCSLADNFSLHVKEDLEVSGSQKLKNDVKFNTSLHIKEKDLGISDSYEIGEVHFNSRLWACIAQNFKTGSKCLPAKTAAKVIKESATDILVVCLPDFDKYNHEDSLSISELLKELGPGFGHILIGCTNLAQDCDDAIKKARNVASENIKFIKLEVLDENNCPINVEVVKATKCLITQGYKNVLPFVSPDEKMINELIELKVSAIRVLASKIGSNKGIKDPELIKKICESTKIPIIVEGGIGTPEHAYEAMSLGATAVLVNSAIVHAVDPVSMARKMKMAVLGGRYEYIQKKQASEIRD